MRKSTYWRIAARCPVARVLFPSSVTDLPYTSIEICAGAGGQALGLERAGFRHLAVVEYDPWACKTLRTNRPDWNVIGPDVDTRDPYERDPARGDVTLWNADDYKDRVTLFAGGVPCPPYSKAGRQLGADDDRDLFPDAFRLIDQCRPRAIMLENVRGILDDRFADWREDVLKRLRRRYWAEWKLLQASDFGVPQLRPRAILVAVEKSAGKYFNWPEPTDWPEAKTVGETLLGLMSANGWWYAPYWAQGADGIAPTLVGGSRKHGGPDLGPTRAKREWRKLVVDAMGLADRAPERGHVGMPRLTVEMAGVLQGFDPEEWPIAGRKTAAYRQVGNAFPPPVAHAVGSSIRRALEAADAKRHAELGNVIAMPQRKRAAAAAATA